MTLLESPDTRVPPGREAPLEERPRRDVRPVDGEEQSITRVVTSLIAMFPAVPEPHIRDCVTHIREGFANAPIRTYIPILVARQARAALLTYASAAAGAHGG